MSALPAAQGAGDLLRLANCVQRAMMHAEEWMP